jgi:DNA-binding LacI/PurR family transcriptional regulator
MGRVAVRHLATRLMGSAHDIDVEVTVPATLVERESVARRSTES